MAKFEQYGDFLLPVSDILYVEYRNPNRKVGDELSDYQQGGTFVWISQKDLMTKAIRISKKNVVADFNKWLAKVASRSAEKAVSINEPINKGLSDWKDEWDKNTTPSWPKGFCPFAPYADGRIMNPFIQVVETKDNDKPFDVSPKVTCLNNMNVTEGTPPNPTSGGGFTTTSENLVN